MVGNDPSRRLTLCVNNLTHPPCKTHSPPAKIGMKFITYPCSGMWNIRKESAGKDQSTIKCFSKSALAVLLIHDASA